MSAIKDFFIVEEDPKNRDPCGCDDRNYIAFSNQEDVDRFTRREADEKHYNYSIWKASDFGSIEYGEGFICDDRRRSEE